MENLFFKDEDAIKVLNEVENYITKDINNSQDLQKFKENYLFLAVYDIAHTFYLNYIDINNCVTISSARTLSRKLYELLLYLKYILESDSESSKRAERYFSYNEYEKVRVLVSNAKDGGFSQQEIKNLENELINLEQLFIKTFENSKIKITKVNEIKKWYMEKVTSNKKIGNIELLSKYLNMNYYYQHIYRSFSSDVHSIGNEKNKTIYILGTNLDISNRERRKFGQEDSLTSEIELSSFTNYIVSRFIELCCDFINNKQLWFGYKQHFEQYFINKWQS
ncbi:MULTISPECIES: DUF5677 domain-containing protein [Staphylococcus]|uniref:DUF5677 domain-containing protein n=1 Tax=Staphylococcus TaxID=1279 RepID=UPI00208F873E|nr:DUF5677 domain-containing protein [Staphylococcus chromogenes]MCO4356116.1 DUF5677 domain-containing protein [Staphylococcus agnetis]MCO4365790.1 DUF5677 domain-containing protein [Staphylococcus agnetis]MDT0656349.1 DUF5677 domain-containing protein [Staphylococcus chromogenes]MDT0672747.1 DUF5677 domain-containing protein [Staphylococcus chromogenes]MDT0674937.1 DUF5677 domain-containing protein [Staphylococcus chromogenes]